MTHPPIAFSIADITKTFPDFHVAVLGFEGLAIPPERPSALDALIAEGERATRARWGGTELSQIPGVAAWRGAYRAFGVKQTRYRSAVERLVKNVLAERPLPRINGFVDAYNLVSLTHVLPAGADDLDRVAPPLAFRFARAGDTFLDMADVDQGGGAGEGTGESGAGLPEAEAVPAGEVVYADARNVLCRRWNWRQDARSLIGPQTARAVVTIQGNGAGDVAAAADELCGLVARFCGGEVRVACFDRERPQGAV